MSDFKFRIVATAPTVYQKQSLSRFCLNEKSLGNGSFFGSMDFYDEKDAKDYLIDRAEKYFDGNSNDDENKLKEALIDIEHGVLTLDAVTARIEEIYEEE